MNLIILGAGTSIPLNYMASPSLALIMNDRCALLDIGPGTLRQLTRIGICHERIDQIFLSHFHPDHTADLIHFLFVTRYSSNIHRREPFRIIGPRGLKDFLKRLKSGYGKWLDVSPEIMSIEELDIERPDNIECKGFSVISQPVEHTPHSLAFRIKSIDGGSFVYSGDTAFCNEIIELAKGCNLLILECSHPEVDAREGHLTPSQAGRVATLAGVKKLLLVHFYPEALASDIAEDCRSTYDGELILGRDLLELSI